MSRTAVSLSVNKQTECKYWCFFVYFLLLKNELLYLLFKLTKSFQMTVSNKESAMHCEDRQIVNIYIYKYM